MKAFLRHFSAAALVLLVSGTATSQVLDYYQASVKVASQDPGARDKALREALAGVLARVSGQADLGSSGRSSPILARASALVRSVNYVRDEQDQLMLQAVFEPRAVDAALKQQGLPVHGMVGAALEGVTLNVSGVGSPDDYARVLAYLRGLPGVKNLGVISAAGSNLTLTLRAEGGAARLVGALGIGGVLRREGTGEDPLSFSLKR